MSPSPAVINLGKKLLRGQAKVVATLVAFLLCVCVASAETAREKEEVAEEPDRWAVENSDYSDKWAVESNDMEERWGVATRRFEDSLGEKSADHVPIIHRSVTFDTTEIPGSSDKPAPQKKKSDAKKSQSKKTEPKAGAAKSGDKKKAASKKKTDGKKKSDGKKKVVEKKASSKPADKSQGKKGSYKKYPLDVNGKPREYYVYLPAGFQKGKKYPVVIAFHGFQSDANGMRWLIKPDKWADKYQYIVVYPNAVNKSWNVGKGTGSANKNTDDVAFSKALYKQVLAKHPVDSNRLYVMGFSNGAQMAALWVCQMAGKISAAAMVAHTMNIPGCKPSHKTPIALLHGMQDKLAPYKGGGKHKLASHKDSVDFFRKVNGTSDKKVHLQSSKTYKCESWTHSKNITEVIDCKMYNNGHSWPGGVEFMVDVLGTTNKDFNATEFLFRMFSKYKKPPAPR